VELSKGYGLAEDNEEELDFNKEEDNQEAEKREQH
jgi:hypothetical protein